jgi:hypothetical protein
MEQLSLEAVVANLYVVLCLSPGGGSLCATPFLLLVGCYTADKADRKYHPHFVPHSVLIQSMECITCTRVVRKCRWRANLDRVQT